MIYPSVIAPILPRGKDSVNMGTLPKNSQKEINFFTCYYIALFLVEQKLWPDMVILKFLYKKKDFCLEIYQYNDVFEARAE